MFFSTVLICNFFPFIFKLDDSVNIAQELPFTDLSDAVPALPDPPQTIKRQFGSHKAHVDFLK